MSLEGDLFHDDVYNRRENNREQHDISVRVHRYTKGLC